jgi:hypothetical protein
MMRSLCNIAVHRRLWGHRQRRGQDGCPRGLIALPFDSCRDWSFIAALVCYQLLPISEAYDRVSTRVCRADLIIIIDLRRIA